MISFGIAYFFYYFVKDTNDQATKYFFIFLLPNFLVSFFVFGWFPIICNWMGLVITRENFGQIMQRRKQAEMQDKVKKEVTQEANTDALKLDIK